LVLAADHVSPQAINFMARFGRGLICLALTRSHCERLHLCPMTSRNGTRHGTAFTVSIEAAQGVSTGISAADRAHTIATAVAANAQASDLVQPGHIFPLQAVEGGVLMRAGHTEAGCDLAALAGGTPAAVICEIMKDDGSMARLPDLEVFAKTHGLRIGTITDLIAYRSRTESLITPLGKRPMQTAHGTWVAHAFSDKPSQGAHLALVKGEWSPDATVLTRVHEPLSVLDVLEWGRRTHSWSLDESLACIAKAGQGIVVLLNCGETPQEFLAQFEHSLTNKSSFTPSNEATDLRTYGIGAQILKVCGVEKMRLLGQHRHLPSMAGYGLTIVDYLEKPQACV
jgi:3,4-dihydroxy 2-butanone 4-phosphate synthase/GTP cyclohydrolase II